MESNNWIIEKSLKFRQEINDLEAMLGLLKLKIDENLYANEKIILQTITTYKLFGFAFRGGKKVEGVELNYTIFSALYSILTDTLKDKNTQLSELLNNKN